jgi:hypothetical protein
VTAMADGVGWKKRLGESVRASEIGGNECWRGEAHSTSAWQPGTSRTRHAREENATHALGRELHTS